MADTSLRWVRLPFHPDNKRFMAVGHGGYVYIVGPWHGADNWQGSKWSEKGSFKRDSKSFHGPNGSTKAREWCEAQNKKHAPRRRPRG